MTWLAIRALLSRIPVIAYVIAFAVLLLTGFGFFLFHRGVSAGETRVIREQLEKKADKAETLKTIATAETDRNRKAAAARDKISIDGRAARKVLRDSVTPLLAGLPEPVLALIKADDAQIARDSITITVHSALDSAWMVERDRRMDADSVAAERIALEEEAPPPEQHHGRSLLYALGGAVVGAAAILALVAR